MRIFVALVIGFVIGAFAIWVYRDNVNKPNPQPIGEQIKDSAHSAGDTLRDKLGSLKLRREDITNELASSGKVIREKSRKAGEAIADATADARITTAIKGKLIADSGLSTLSISVNTTEGVVTLSGTVPSEEYISQAMSISLETDGVSKVISTLQLKR